MKKIFLDTDMSADCDDVGALVVLHALEARGECNIIGITHCTTPPYGARCIQAINDYYGKPDIPIGELKESDFIIGEPYEKYNKILGEPYSDREYEDAVRLMRGTLAKERDVILTAIGPFRNIRNLLQSGPDEYSPLNGIDLVKQSVIKLVTMSGFFGEVKPFPEYIEWNVEMDVEAGRYVIEHCPVPMVFSGYEIGDEILTGDNFDVLPDENPLKRAYALYTGGEKRPSFDLTAVYQAVREENDLWESAGNVKIKADTRGEFYPVPGGPDAYMKRKASVERCKKELDELLTEIH